MPGQPGAEPPGRRALSALFALLLALVLAASPARALDWATLAQPTGTFVGNAGYPSGVYEASAINTILGGNPPFDGGTGVTLIRVTQAHQYVRFYNPADPVNPSNAVGAWMMLASEVRGLTAAQIRDKFALPALPTNIVQVNVPAGYALYTGIAAPIAGWGDGGGLQNRAMANKAPAGVANDPWLPASSFVNAQALDSGAVLSYGRAASGVTSAAGVAAHLDRLQPRAHSDLAGLCDALDSLLLSGDGASVDQALARFSPAAFQAVNGVSLRTGALYAASLNARAGSLAEAASGSALGRSGGGAPEGWSLWMRGAAEYLRSDERGETPYGAVTGAVHAGWDRPVGEEFVLGMGVSAARTQLDWEHGGGDAGTTTLGLSAYGFWTRGDWFAGGDLGLDASLTEARRRIATAVTDRTASSSQSGEGGSLRLRAGRRFALGGEGWVLAPAAELGYVLHRQNPFRETGAGDLNLAVEAATTQTLRTGAELALSRRVALADGGALSPELALGWLRETPLDGRSLRAAFSGYAGSFQTSGDDSPKDSLLLRAGLSHQDGGGLLRYGRYSGQLREGFQSHSVELGLRWEF